MRTRRPASAGLPAHGLDYSKPLTAPGDRHTEPRARQEIHLDVERLIHVFVAPGVEQLYGFFASVGFAEMREPRLALRGRRGAVTIRVAVGADENAAGCE